MSTVDFGVNDTADGSADGAALPGWRRAALPAIAAVCVIAAALAVFFGTSWALAARDPSIAVAAGRDQALQSGRQEIINLNTLDYRSVDQGLNLWEASSTGAFLQELQQYRAPTESSVTKAKTATTARVTDAAISQLDTQAGKATMLAVVNVTVTPDGQQPVQKVERYQAELTRAGPQWKISALNQVQSG